MGKDSPSPKKELSQGGQAKQPRLDADDLAELEAFCAGIELDDIGFQDWADVHHKLDLVVQLYITAAELKQGGAREVEFVRTCYPQGLGRKQKEKVCLMVSWPENSPQAYRLLFVGQGDRRGRDCGDAMVVLIGRGS